MTAFFSIITSLKDKIIAVAIAVAAAFFIYTTRRNRSLDEKVEHLETKEEANEVRRRPVPDDKHDILDRM